MPALSAFVTTLTQTKLLPKVVDNIMTGNVLLMRLLPKARTWNGGTSIQIPINISTYNQVGSYSGFDTFNTTQQNTRVQATFDPAQYYVTCNISGIQAAVSRGTENAVDLVTTELDQRSKDLQDYMGTDLYSDGTNNSSKAMTGLAAAVDDSTSVKYVAEVKSDYMLETPSIRQYAFA